MCNILRAFKSNNRILLHYRKLTIQKTWGTEDKVYQIEKPAIQSFITDRTSIPSQITVHPELQNYNTEQSAQGTAGSDGMPGCLNTAWNAEGS